MSRLSFRPRPLDIHKKLPIVKSIKDFEDEETISSTRNSQLQRLAAEADNEVHQTPSKKIAAEIPIPQFVVVDTYERDYSCTFSQPTSYLRARGVRAEIGDFVEYDLDNEDEDWLQELNNERKILSPEKFESILFKLEVLDHKARERAGIITPTLGSPIPVVLQAEAAFEGNDNNAPSLIPFYTQLGEGRIPSPIFYLHLAGKRPPSLSHPPSQYPIRLSTRRSDPQTQPLGDNLEPSVLFRIIEVLHSAYKAGRVQIADYISFFVTLLAYFRVLPENYYPSSENDEKIRSLGTFKVITRIISSCLSRIGDDNLVLQILEKAVVDEMSLKLPLDNKSALLRILVTLDSKPTRLSDQSIIKLSKSLLEYMIDAAPSIPENDSGSRDSVQLCNCQYHFVPCFFLFDRSDKFLNLVLDLMGSSVGENNAGVEYAFDLSHKICAIASILQFMYKDPNLQRRLLSCHTEVNRILQSILFQSSTKTNFSLEQRQRIQSAFDQLQSATSKLKQ